MSIRPAPDIPFLTSSGSIYAGAGAGKTSTSVSLHANASDRGARVVVITFTNNTVHDYIARANHDRPGLASSNDVFTFHKLASYLLGDAEKRGAASLETVVALAVEHVRDVGLRADMLDVRVLIVDESQDCSEENYSLACLVADRAGATLVMVGDANQALYGFRNASPRFLLGHSKATDGFVHELPYNWRSTPQIVALSKRFMRHPLNTHPSPRATAGDTPGIIVCDPKVATTDAIQVCVKALARSRTVMLIGRSKRPRYDKGRLVRMGLQLFINDLERSGVPFNRMFREAADDEGCAVGCSGIRKDAINVLTIHGSKGLEADTVVVIDALDERVGDKASPDQLELMYVAISRARSELTIVNSRFGRCDPTLMECVSEGLCELTGQGVLSAQAITRDVRERFSVTQLLSDRTLVGETELLTLARALDIDPKPFVRAKESPLPPLPELDDLRTLYGHLAENCAQMTYNSARQGTDPDAPETYIIDRLSVYVDARIAVPSAHVRALSSLFTMTGARRSDSITRDDVCSLRARLAKRPEQYGLMLALLAFISESMASSGLTRAVLTTPSLTQKVPMEELRQILRSYHGARSDSRRLPYVFAACLFFHQLDNHAGYRWGREYIEHVSAFKPRLALIREMTKSLPDGCTFEREVNFKHLRLAGRVDVSCPGRFIELKFVSQLGLTHFMQPCLYGVLDGCQFSKRAEVWNLATGEKVLVRYDNSSYKRWSLFQALAGFLKRTVSVNDIEAKVVNPWRGIRLHSDTLRATCEVECDEDIDEAVAFTTAGRGSVRTQSA